MLIHHNHPKTYSCKIQDCFSFSVMWKWWLSVVFSAFVLAWCSSKLPWSCFGINLGQIFSQVSFQIFPLFLFFFFICYYHYVCNTFCSCPKVLRFTFFFQSFFFSLLLFSFRFLLRNPQVQKNLSLAMSSLLINPSKAFFIYAIVVFISSIPFWLLGFLLLCFQCHHSCMGLFYPLEPLAK